MAHHLFFYRTCASCPGSWGTSPGDISGICSRLIIPVLAGSGREPRGDHLPKTCCQTHEQGSLKMGTSWLHPGRPAYVSSHEVLGAVRLYEVRGMFAARVVHVSADEGLRCREVPSAKSDSCG